jgi:DNA-binding HxlR family transcriptional regulator
MAPRRDYPSQSCPIARTLELVGERWTLLIVRDAFYGVQRFSDFHVHLGVPKAVLSERISLLVAHKIMTAVPGPNGKDCYELTARGRGLWPVVWSLIRWGNDNFYERETWRRYLHADCGGAIDNDRVCERCAAVPEPGDIMLHPPKRPRVRKDDAISVALRKPHRLLEPLLPA